MNEAAIEQEIQDKNLNAPRLRPEQIDALISSVTYWHPGRDVETMAVAETAGPDEKALACLTVCALTLKNGFTVVGKSACASPENFDLELGRKIAFTDARQQIWMLAGYKLRCDLAEGATKG